MEGKRFHKKESPKIIQQVQEEQQKIIHIFQTMQQVIILIK